MSNSAAGGASQDDIRQAQEALQDQGLYHGQVDGKWGPQTKQAVSQFQKKNGLKQSAQLDQQTLDDLQNNSSGSSSGSMSGGSSSSGRSPNSSSSFNSGSGSSSGMSGGNGPATTQTNPGGQNRSSVPSGAPAH
jgi:peptidoglycan hydrolase-like protein with peptidoglycan-binding domain